MTCLLCMNKIWTEKKKTAEKEEEAARSKRKISEATDKPETNGVSADIIWDTLDRGEKNRKLCTILMIFHKNTVLILKVHKREIFVGSDFEFWTFLHSICLNLLVCTIKITKLTRITYSMSPSMKSVKFWRENPANEYSVSSGKY